MGYKAYRVDAAQKHETKKQNKTEQKQKKKITSSGLGHKWWGYFKHYLEQNAWQFYNFGVVVVVFTRKYSVNSSWIFDWSLRMVWAIRLPQWHLFKKAKSVSSIISFGFIDNNTKQGLKDELLVSKEVFLYHILKKFRQILF